MKKASDTQPETARTTETVIGEPVQEIRGAETKQSSQEYHLI